MSRVDCLVARRIQQKRDLVESSSPREALAIKLKLADLGPIG